MSTIPTSLTEKEFNEHINPYLSKAKRGFICKIPLYKIFNYILYRLHTGCQWDQLPIDPDPHQAQKKKSAAMQCTTTFASGRGMAV
jgi:transposase